MQSKYTKFLSLPFWVKIFQNFLKACHRFPLSITCILVVTFLVILENHRINPFGSGITFRRILFIGIVSGFWFLAVGLFSESHNRSKLQQYQLAIPVFALICWQILTHVGFSSSLTLLLAMVMAVSFSAYLFRAFDNASIWYFNYQLTAGLCFALLSAFILCAGLSLVLKSIDYLFEIHINHKFFFDIWLLGICFFTPTYFLANVPTQFDYERSNCEFPRGVHFIQNYILTPLSLVYMVVLYAYLIKITFQWELPRGNLGKMISIFGVIGIYTHLSLYPVYDRSSSLLNWFYRHFYKMMIIPLGLLMLAISTRIMAYGLTDARYFVIICIVWFSLLIFSYFQKGIKFQLRNVPLILSALAILSSFGFWGINPLPTESQFSRLEAILVKNKLLVNQQYMTPSTQPDIETRKSISSMIRYIVSHGEGKKMLPWFSESDKSVIKPLIDCADRKKHCVNDSKIMKQMGLNYVNHWERDNQFTVTLKRTNGSQHPDSLRLIPVTGFDYIVPISLYNGSCIKKECKEIIDQSWQHTGFKNVKIDFKDNHINITSDNFKKITFDLDSLLQRINAMGKTILPAEESQKLILNQSTDKIKAKLLINRFNGEIKNGKKLLTSINGVLLLALTP